MKNNPKKNATVGRKSHSGVFRMVNDDLSGVFHNSIATFSLRRRHHVIVSRTANQWPGAAP